MDYYFRSGNTANSPMATAIERNGMQLAVGRIPPLKPWESLLWEYQSGRATTDWSTVKAALAPDSRLAIWVNDYSAFRQENQCTDFLERACCVVVPSRVAKRDLILHHELDGGQIVVQELIDLPIDWQLTGSVPFSPHVHQWTGDTPVPVYLKEVYRAGGWGRVDETNPYNPGQSLAVFLAAGLPVITQRGSAAADLVSQYRLGLVVDDLHSGWENDLAKVDERHYREYSSRVTDWGQKLRQGWFTERTLNKIQFQCHFSPSPFANYSSIYRPAQFGLKVMDSTDTADFIQSNQCSVARFGDGEIALLNGAGQVFQDPDPDLRQRLNEIVQRGSNSRLLVCLSDVFHGLDILVPSAHDWWAGHLEQFGNYYRQLAEKGNVYGNTMLTRPYMDFNDRSGAQAIFASIRRLWQDRDVLLVEGYYTRSGVGNDLYANAHSVERIICPSKNAWNKHQAIEAAIKEHGEGKLVLVMLGMAATVIAADLADWGQVIDLGHLDSEYEWFQMGATERVPLQGKHTAEMNYDTDIAGVHDATFQQQIILNLAGRPEE